MNFVQLKSKVLFKLLFTLRSVFRYDLIAGLRFKSSPSDLVKVGSQDCGWIIPESQLSHTEVCYCVGAGEDISFDLELSRLYGKEVYTFDPTPRAILHYESLSYKEKSAITFHPWGLWTEDSILRFYEPSDPKHVSHSIVNLQNTEKGFDAQCHTYTSITTKLKHSKVDLLKIDIEGAELNVIPHFLGSAQLPSILLVEFDTIRPPARLHEWAKVRNICKQLTKGGYVLVAAEESNYTFTRIRDR